MTIGERLREERERLALTQPAFAALAGTTKQTLFSWESGKTAPDGFQLAALSESGVDVFYVVVGVRDPAAPALDSAERVLVDSYRRCSPEGRSNLIQTAALLAAGVGEHTGKPARKASGQKPAATDMSRMKMVNREAGGIQIGYAGGKVSIKKGR